MGGIFSIRRFEGRWMGIPETKSNKRKIRFSRGRSWNERIPREDAGDRRDSRGGVFSIRSRLAGGRCLPI